MARFTCPNCKSQRFGQSRTKNTRERFLKITGNSPYRCAECGWRGYIKDRRGLGKDILQFILIVVFILWVAYAAYLSAEDFLRDYRAGINKAAMEKPKPEPSKAQ